MSVKSKSTKEIELLAKAKELFWKHGFRRVSIEEICREANVSKMTFYRYFPNKLELAKTVFDGVVDEGVQKFKALMAQDVKPSEKMKAFITMKMEGTNDISREFLQDFYSNPELGLSTYIEQKTLRVWGGIIDDFREAQRRGEFRNDFKPEIILLVAQKIMELLNDDNVQGMYTSPQELIVELANIFTYGISPHE